MKRILIIEDDRAIQKGLGDNLKAEHFEVVTESDGEVGLKRAAKERVDLIVLDVMLPGLDGFEVCKRLRASGSTVPILMLTGKGQEVDKVLGLELGADDYVTKPFSIREVIARVKALLRRNASIVSKVEETDIDEVHVNFKKLEAYKGKKKLKMSAKEFELLRYFVEREGEVISRDKLLDEVWGYETTPTTRTVDNYILTLRKKIEAVPSNPKHFITIHTAGYKFLR